MELVGGEYVFASRHGRRAAAAYVDEYNPYRGYAKITDWERNKGTIRENKLDRFWLDDAPWGVHIRRGWLADNYHEATQEAAARNDEDAESDHGGSRKKAAQTPKAAALKSAENGKATGRPPPRTVAVAPKESPAILPSKKGPAPKKFASKTTGGKHKRAPNPVDDSTGEDGTDEDEVPLEQETLRKSKPKYGSMRTLTKKASNEAVETIEDEEEPEEVEAPKNPAKTPAKRPAPKKAAAPKKSATPASVQVKNRITKEPPSREPPAEKTKT